MFDVIEVTGDTVRLIAEKKSERNAEAIVEMAVMRRGVDNSFFVATPHKLYKDGDIYKGL